MADARDIIQALDHPAALFDSAGALLMGNAAFEARIGDPTAVADLTPGERRDTLALNGSLIAWTVTDLADGERLALGREVADGPGVRERYLASLSHELRTPLNGVLGMAGLLAETKLAAEQRAYLAALQDSGVHLLGLVNDILDLARIDAGRLTLHPAPVDISRLLQSVAELLSPRAFAKSLEIASTTRTRLPSVMADEGRLRQILFNLAGNAVKFTEAGGVMLDVEARRGDGDKLRLRFIVADTGPGVAEAQRERIFEAFAQADPAHGARADSSGLGLAIVRRLAAAHDGTVGLDCPEHGGSRFSFEAEFPVCEAAPETPLLTGRRVLVALAQPDRPRFRARPDRSGRRDGRGLRNP